VSSADLFDIESLTLGDYAERAYLDYAVSVVKGRALPDVFDGQKPVQRRILYAMHEMGLDFVGSTGAKPVKSARVVGDVIGKFHPHGDQSAYDALVRLAQDFVMRYPLIDGQGNFGSRDGDGAAAFRYTEARLSPFARLLLDEIDLGTVDFQPNYDGSTKEPKLLPARLPIVLLNGASGIAVGLATEIPSHNLSEVAAAAVALIKAGEKAALADLLEHIKGPDFPGGGQIISSAKEIAEIYQSGRGSLKLRARYQIEELARGQWQLVVTELPPGVSARRIGEEVEELTNPKVRLGKKALSAEQVQLKQTVLGVLDQWRNESGREASVRLVFEPKSRTLNQAEFVQTLLAHTSLESSLPVNLVMIGRDGRPRQKGLLEILGEWIEGRLVAITRRSQFRLAQVQDRIHVLEGRLIVFLHIDRVIAIIRASDEPKPALIEAFGLSERQADDILEIRLRQLARLEGIRLEKEVAELGQEKDRLNDLLASPAAMRRLMIKEIEADAKMFGDARRTLVQEEKRTVAELKLADDPVSVVVSEKGWLRSRLGHGLDASQLTYKAGDQPYAVFECRTVDTLICVGSNGRVYSVPVAQLPGGRGDGAPVTSLIDVESGSRIVHFIAGPGELPILMASNAGYGFVCQLKDMLSRVRGGKTFFSLDSAEEPLRPAPIDLKADIYIACLSSAGRLLVFPANEIRMLAGGGRGVILQELDQNEQLLQSIPVAPAGLIVAGAGRGGKEATQLLSGAALQSYLGKRARKGKSIGARFKPARLQAQRPAAPRQT
jgi:topoisomerase-4 subunit A